MISSIGAPLQTLGAPNTPLWIVHSGEDLFETNEIKMEMLFIFKKEMKHYLPLSNSK